jgi:preprotein translocase subunit SecE
MDTIKLLVSVLLLVAAIGGFYVYEEQVVIWMRILGLLAVVGVAVAVALQSAAGRRIWAFAVDSRTEVRKVVWPSRQETIQTTLIVFGMVLVIGIILWLVDMMFLSIVRAVTG